MAARNGLPSMKLVMQIKERTMRYIPNLIVLAGGALLLLLGMSNSSLPQFVLLYMIVGGAAFIVCGLIMFFATLREHL